MPKGTHAPGNVWPVPAVPTEGRAKSVGGGASLSLADVDAHERRIQKSITVSRIFVFMIHLVVCAGWHVLSFKRRACLPCHHADRLIVSLGRLASAAVQLVYGIGIGPDGHGLARAESRQPDRRPLQWVVLDGSLAARHL